MGKRKGAGGGAYAGGGNKSHRPKIRAHRNPLADGEYDFPETPSAKDWSSHYPSVEMKEKEVTVADVGCGFGGLLENLSPVLPQDLILGLEIRPPVVTHVQERITKLRAENKGHNISVVMSNVMKHCANFFRKGQLQKIFFCFPDPHFKKSNFRRRIISHALLDVYAYVLAPGGICYTITDVEDLHVWMKEHLDQHPLFEAVDYQHAEHKEHAAILDAMRTTDEGKKVTRFKGSMYITVHRRVLNDAPAAPAATAAAASSAVL